MPFIDRILRYKSLSIIGLEKNTGKTECVTYVLNRLSGGPATVAVTSIGVDGEETDRVTGTPKPAIRLHKGMVFTTVAQYYLSKTFLSEICGVGTYSTTLGKMVTARALEEGTVQLAGPSTTFALRHWMDQVREWAGVDLCLVDGALSRFSHASPAVSQSLILCTGAAYSSHLAKLVKRTRFVCDCIALPQAPPAWLPALLPLQTGLYGVTPQGTVVDTGVVSTLQKEQVSEALERAGNVVYAAGAVSSTFLRLLSGRKEVSRTQLIVRDFSKLFVEPLDFYQYLQRGGTISQLYTTHLEAVCVNPYSPTGYHLNATQLEEEMQAALHVPVYNIKRLTA